jgi:hypothetical protein
VPDRQTEEVADYFRMNGQGRQPLVIQHIVDLFPRDATGHAAGSHEQENDPLDNQDGQERRSGRNNGVAPLGNLRTVNNGDGEGRDNQGQEIPEDGLLDTQLGAAKADENWITMDHVVRGFLMAAMKGICGVWCLFMAGIKGIKGIG